MLIVEVATVPLDEGVNNPLNVGFDYVLQVFAKSVRECLVDRNSSLETVVRKHTVIFFAVGA